MPHVVRKVAACVAACFVWSAVAATSGDWAAVAGYHPGMTKEAAKKAGLAECKAFLGTVKCKGDRALRIGVATTTSSEIVLDEKTGRVERVELQFSGDSHEVVAAAMVAQLGEPSAKEGDFKADYWLRAGFGSCTNVLLWHRGTDDVVAVCWASGRRGRPTYLVADRVPGRGHEWAKTAAAREKNTKTADSFNSK